MSKRVEADGVADAGAAAADDARSAGETQPTRVVDEDARRAKRRERKLQKRWAGGDKGVLQQLYSGCTPDIVVSAAAQERGAPALRTKDAQDLVLWLLTDEVANPSWVFVRHKPLVRKVLCVFMPRRTESVAQVVARAYNAALLPLQGPGSNTTVVAPSVAVLRVPVSRAGRKLAASALAARALEDAASGASATADAADASASASTSSGKAAPVPLAQLAASAEEMAAHEYPQRDACAVATLVSGEDGVPPRYEAVALDCEMVIDERREFMLARVTVVDAATEVVLVDEFVKPARRVLDYNTRFSGVTEELLAGATHTIDSIRARLLEIVDARTLVIGHGLENDWRALGMFHRRNIDTAIAYRSAGATHRPALRNLALQHLKVAIQTGSHDSAEDAIAALRLVKLKQEHGRDYGVAVTSPVQSLFAVLQSHQRACALVGPPAWASQNATGSAHVLPCETWAQLGVAVRGQLANAGVHFVCVHEPNPQAGHTDAEHDTDAAVEQFVHSVRAHAPPNTAALWIIGGRAPETVRSSAGERRDGTEWSADREEELRAAVSAARSCRLVVHMLNATEV